MAAYMIVQTAISNPHKWGLYREAVIPVIAAFGGKLLTRNSVKSLEGEHDGRGPAIFEFRSMDAIHAFWQSPEYRPVKAIRDGAAVVDI